MTVAAPTHRIKIIGGAEFSCPEDERVLIAMERSGCDEINVGCRGGGCGFCRVRVADGPYRTGKMSAAKVSREDQAAGYVLACRLYPSGDLTIEVD
jgi:ferredoxin